MDICDNLSDGLHAAPNFDPFGEYLFVNAINLENGFIVDKGDGKRADQLEYEKYRIDLNERTILYSIDGSIGKIAKYRGEKVILGKGACYIMLKETVNTDYIYYLLQSSIFQGYLKAMTTGSTIHHISLETMRNFRFDLPKRKVQDRIATVLSLLDNRIDLNNSICAELESMAKTLYDYWFVQFDFPDENGKPYRTGGGKMKYSKMIKSLIPEGWIETVLSDIANITMGQSPSGESFNEAGEGEVFYQGSTDFGNRFPTPRVYTTAPSRFAKKGDILMSVRAPVGTLNIAMEDCCIGRGLSALNSKSGSQLHLLYVLTDYKMRFDAMNSNGTTFGSINKDQLYALPVVAPPGDVLNRFEAIVGPIEKKIQTCETQNRCLAKLRDWLLPMLMNGQAKVVDAKKEETPVAEETATSIDGPRFVNWLNTMGLAARGTVDRQTLHDIFDAMDEDDKQ